MLPGWNQVRLQRLPGSQSPANSSHNQWMQGSYQGQMMSNHGPGYTNHPMMSSQHLEMGNGCGQMMNQQNMYPQQYPHPQQMYQQQMMVAYHMNNQQQATAPQQPPALPPSQPPPPNPAPPPPPPVDEDKPAPPLPPLPDSGEKWWTVELNKMTDANKVKLERLLKEKWFLDLSKDQQIECWQHKLQLVSKQSQLEKTVAASFSPELKTSTIGMVAEPATSSMLPSGGSDSVSEWSSSNNEDPQVALSRYQEQLGSLMKQNETFARQYNDWHKQFEDWKKKHINHPNKTQFVQYEKQWVTWQEQMEQQKTQNLANIKRLQSNIKKIQYILTHKRNNEMQHQFQPSTATEAGPTAQREQNHPHPPANQFQQQYGGPRPDGGWPRRQVPGQGYGQPSNQSMNDDVHSHQLRRSNSDENRPYDPEEALDDESDWQEEQSNDFHNRPPAGQQIRPPMPMNQPRQRMPYNMRPQMPANRMLRPRIPNSVSDPRLQEGMSHNARPRFPVGQRYVRPPPHQLLQRFGQETQDEDIEEDTFESHEAGDGPGKVRPRMPFGRGASRMRMPMRPNYAGNNRMAFRPRGPHFSPRLRNMQPSSFDGEETEESYGGEQQELEEEENVHEETFARAPLLGPRPRLHPRMPHRFARPPRPRFPGTTPRHPRFRPTMHPRPRHIQNFENVCVYDEGGEDGDGDDYLVEDFSRDQSKEQGGRESDNFQGSAHNEQLPVHGHGPDHKHMDQNSENVSRTHDRYDNNYDSFGNVQRGPEPPRGQLSTVAHDGSSNHEVRTGVAERGDASSGEAKSKLSLAEAARDIFANNPLFKGDNMKKLREHLQAIKNANLPKDEEEFLAGSTPDFQSGSSTSHVKETGEVNRNAILERAKKLSSLDLKNILSAVKATKDKKPSESDAAGNTNLAAANTSGPTASFAAAGAKPTAAVKQETTEQQTLDKEAIESALLEKLGLNASSSKIILDLANDPLLNALGSDPLREYAGIADDPLLMEYLKFDPLLERDLLMRALRERELLEEARRIDPYYAQPLDVQWAEEERRALANLPHGPLGVPSAPGAIDDVARRDRDDYPRPVRDDHFRRDGSSDRDAIRSHEGSSRRSLDDESRSRDEQRSDRGRSSRETSRSRDGKLGDRGSRERSPRRDVGRDSSIERDLKSLKHRQEMVDRERRDTEREEKSEQRDHSLERLRAIEEDLKRREEQLRDRERELLRRGRLDSPERYYQNRDRSPGRYDDRHRSKDDRRSPREPRRPPRSPPPRSPPPPGYEMRDRRSPHRDMYPPRDGFMPPFPGGPHPDHVRPPFPPPYGGDRVYPFPPHMQGMPPRPGPPPHGPGFPPYGRDGRRDYPSRDQHHSPGRDRSMMSPHREREHSRERGQPDRGHSYHPPHDRGSPDRRFPRDREHPRDHPREHSPRPRDREVRRRSCSPGPRSNRRPSPSDWKQREHDRMRDRFSPKRGERRPSPRRRSRSRSPPPANGRDRFGRDLSERSRPGGKDQFGRDLNLKGGPPEKILKADFPSTRRNDFNASPARLSSPVVQRSHNSSGRSTPVTNTFGLAGPNKSLKESNVGFPTLKPPVLMSVNDLINMPGRLKRPGKIVVILRGLPGCGKTHIAKMIRDKESSFRVSPRMLSLDDYFMTETEKFEKDPDSGKKVKEKVFEYEYEPEMEESYRSNLMRAFKKTLEDGYFSFVIVDAVHEKVKHFAGMYDVAKSQGFEVFIAEIMCDVHVCARRNVHDRTLADIQKLASGWESTPPQMNRLDLRLLVQDSEIQEVKAREFCDQVLPTKLPPFVVQVEMDDISEDEQQEEPQEKPVERMQEEAAAVPKSKWDSDSTAARLAKLDGIAKKTVKRSMGDFLSLPDDYESRKSAPGKKRVRWADIHERQTQQRMRDVGFVVGSTDWSRMMDDSHADRALNRTKFI